MSVYKGNALVLPDAQGGAYFDSFDARLQIKISNQNFDEIPEPGFSYSNLNDLTSFIFYNNKSYDKTKDFGFAGLSKYTSKIKQIVFSKNEIEGNVDCREMCEQFDNDSVEFIDFSDNFLGNVDFGHFAYRNETLQIVNFKGTTATNVQTFNQAFNGCSALKTVNMSGGEMVVPAQGQIVKTYLNCIDGCSLTEMFLRCKNLQSANLSGIRGENLSCGAMFGECSALQMVDLSGVKSFYGATNMFYGCTNLWSIDLRGLTSFENYSIETFRGVPIGCTVFVSSETVKDQVEYAGRLAGTELTVRRVEPNNEPIPWSLGDDD